MVIDKKQVVKDNIEQAIYSLFQNQNYAASKTLIGSASSVLKDLLRDESFRKTTANLFPEIEERKIYEELDKSWNFFKHANNKDEKEIEIEVEDILKETLLVIRDYRALYIDPTLLMQSYELWFFAKDKSFFELLPHEKRASIIEEFGKLYEEELFTQIKKGWVVIKKHINHSEM
ncbi:MAG: hypothetical protein KGQ36_04610 [Rickettsiales bacterium]|nr:hypothetical protein [Rickettsiales bacterium]